MPLFGERPDALEMLPLSFHTLDSPGVSSHVLSSRDEFKVANVVVAGIAVDVMDFHPIGDRPVVKRPDIAMQQR